MSTPSVTTSGGAGGRIIHVCVIVDTERVLEGVTQPPDPGAAPASIDESHAHLIVTENGPAEDQGTARAALAAGARDVIRVFASSASNQFEHAVLLVGIQQAQGDAALGRCDLVTQARAGIVPASATSALPARVVEQHFMFCDCSVEAEGTQRVQLAFAIYDRDDHGQPRFAGRYQWESQLTIQFRSTRGETTS
jgi:hypothetical protein